MVNVVVRVGGGTHRALPYPSHTHNADVDIGHSEFVSVDGDAHNDDVCVLSVLYVVLEDVSKNVPCGFRIAVKLEYLGA